MSSDYYILRDAELIPATRLEWERWWFTMPDERIIARTEIDNAEILTQCIGMMPPGSLFRTDVIGGAFDGASESYDSLEDAMLGHERMFGRIENSLDYRA